MADKESNQTAEYLQFGGMAVVEGVMMRSPNYYSVACRAPNNEIIVKTEPLEKTWIGRQNWLKKPFLRGTLAILDTMALGMKAMNFASSVQTDAAFQKEVDQVQITESEAKKQKIIESLAIAGAIAFSLFFGFVVFKAIPELIGETGKQLITGNTANGSKNYTYSAGVWTNLFAGIVKIAFFIGYLAVIRRVPSIYEVFKYHGAEHQSINCVESKIELNQAQALAQTRLHPRCGTNFAIIVLLIGFLTLLFIPRYPVLMGHQIQGVFEPVLLRIGWELLLLPLIAGTSYEVIRAAGRSKDQRWVNILLKPGLATQLITTAPPDAKHIDVAIASLEAVMLAEETGKLTNSIPVESPETRESLGQAPEDVIT